MSSRELLEAVSAEQKAALFDEFAATDWLRRLLAQLSCVACGEEITAAGHVSTALNASTGFRYIRPACPTCYALAEAGDSAALNARINRLRLLQAAPTGRPA